MNRLDAALFSLHYGLTTGSIWSTGDFDADGATTLVDFALLQAHLGQSGASPAASLSAAVPEPSTLLLAAFGLVAIAICRIRRHIIG